MFANKNKHSRTRNLVIVISSFLLLNSLLGYLLIRLSSTSLIMLIQMRMLDISNTAAAMIDGDALRDLTPKDKGTDAYEDVMRTLTYFQDNIDLKYIYCVRDNKDGTFSFGLDPTVADPAEFGTPVVYTEALNTASKGTPAADDESYKDAWGEFYTAYSPVFDSEGRVAGVIAVDFSADWYNKQLNTLLRTTLVFAVLSLFAGAAIVLAISARDRRQLRTVHTQLNELSDNISELIRETGVLSDVQTGSVSTSDGTASDDIESLGTKVLAMQETLSDQISRIHEQAYSDGLTGVRNSTAYLVAIKRLMNLIDAGEASFSVAVFDLNGLKTVNDSYGHECGNLVIKDAARVLVEVFGANSIYRIGGDEFVSIIPGATPFDMVNLFALLEEAIAITNRDPRPYHVPLSMSKGFATYYAGETYNEVFKRADHMMYGAKQAYYQRMGIGRGNEPVSRNAD